MEPKINKLAEKFVYLSKYDRHKKQQEENNHILDRKLANLSRDGLYMRILITIMGLGQLEV